MRLPRLRIKLWWLMLAVAVAGVSIGSWVAVTRFRTLRERYRRMVEGHTKLASIFRENQKQDEDLAAKYGRWAGIDREMAERRRGRPRPWYDFSDPAAERKQAEEYEERVREYRASAAHHSLLAEHHERLRRKYESAADHPWLSVGPDPPEPE